MDGRLSIAPVDDFIGGLKKINRNLAVLISALIVLSIVGFYLRQRITRPLTAVTVGNPAGTGAKTSTRHSGSRSVIREIHISKAPPT